MQKIKSKLIVILVAIVGQTIGHQTDKDIEQTINDRKITYNSLLRIQNVNNKYFIHSHEIKFGQGSGQQSVTAVNYKNDQNSLFLIKVADGLPEHHFSQLVRCGDTIRLEHSNTQKNLHSHEIASAISNNQEVSCYGNKGEGDEADDFIIQCVYSDYYYNTILEDKRVLKGEQLFLLQHKLTHKYLKTDKQYNYNPYNCGRGCPIDGQLEVYAQSSISYNALFKIHSGVFFDVSQQDDSEEYSKLLQEQYKDDL